MEKNHYITVIVMIIDSSCEPATVSPNDEKLNVVFLQETRATICYGCKGKFRSLNDVTLGVVPPVPYDIVFKQRERGMFCRPGSITKRIGKTPYNLYYHAKNSYLLEKIPTLSPNIFHISDIIISKLKSAHRSLLQSEFRLHI